MNTCKISRGESEWRANERADANKRISNRFYAWNENEKNNVENENIKKKSQKGRKVRERETEGKMCKDCGCLNVRCEVKCERGARSKGVRILNCFSCYLRMCLSESHQIGFMLSAHQRNKCVYMVVYVHAGSMFCLPSKQWNTDNCREKKNGTITQRKNREKPMKKTPSLPWVIESKREGDFGVHLNRHVEETSLIRLYILL